MISIFILKPLKEKMERDRALQHLKALKKPVLVDGGYRKSGHLLYILTDAGLITVDCRVYDPILGPIEYSGEQYLEIREIAGESETVAENDDLDPDEKLFLFNDGRPDVPYWAFQPRDEAALDEYLFSADKAAIEQAFIDHNLNRDIEAWEGMDETSLTGWAAKIRV